MLESIRKKILLQYLICYYLLLSRTTSMFARCPKLKTVQAFEIYLLILRFFGSLSQNMKDFQIVIGRSGSQPESGTPAGAAHNRNRNRNRINSGSGKKSDQIFKTYHG